VVAETYPEILTFGLTDEDRERLSTSIAFDARGRLHNKTGPAVTFKQAQKHIHTDDVDAEMFYWYGVQMPKDVVLNHNLITQSRILSETNIEVRRVMLEHYGLKRFFKGNAPVAEDAFGKLYHIRGEAIVPGTASLAVIRGKAIDHRTASLAVRIDDLLAYVWVKNSTPEPDGSFKDYILRVPPTTRTAKEAVAWTFKKTVFEYNPIKET
jgi:hypothetical protein